MVGYENFTCVFSTFAIAIIAQPVAILGGMFAGILRLDLNEEPLKEWVTS